MQVEVATPASKLDAMFTFLKINFSSLWGEEPADEKQFEAKVYKIKMQLEGIDEHGETKIDVAQLRAEIERLQEAAQRGSISADFNPALLLDNKVSASKGKKKSKKAKNAYNIEAPADDAELNQSADFGGDKEQAE